MQFTVPRVSFLFYAMSLITDTTLPTGQLRPHLEGANLPAGFKLPELSEVLQDASQGTDNASSFFS